MLSMRYSAQNAARRFAADELAEQQHVQPSVADHWLWMRWMIRNGLWDSYHFGRGRALVWKNQRLETRDK